MEECRVKLVDGPQLFLEDLVRNPIDFNTLETEDAGAFLTGSIMTALSSLTSRDVAEAYISRLKEMGYAVN